MREKGFAISHDTVGNVLKEMGYSLRQNQKMLQVGVPHPDRNARFEYINNKCGGFIQEGQPVISVDTRKKEFAVESILRWRQTLGKNTCPDASKLYINSDNGGSNGSRLKLWKKQLQEFANITALEVHVSHFPPGASKWNKIEHRMFFFMEIGIIPFHLKYNKLLSYSS